MTMHQPSTHFSSSQSLQISPMSVSSPLSVASMPFDNNGLDPAQASLNRLQQVICLLDSSLRLPNNPQAFMVYLVGLAIVFAGAFMHVFIAAQIMQAEFRLNQLQEEYRAIEQQNGDIIFQIARDTNLTRLQERVVAEGYVPVQKREYVYVPNASLADTAVAMESQPELTAQPAADTYSVVPSVVPSVVQGTGYIARWEEFWNTTWRSATGDGVSASSATPKEARKSAPAGDFWSTWWKQTTTSGSKLLEQFRN